jgi:hypothetical protein
MSRAIGDDQRLEARRAEMTTPRDPSPKTKQFELERGRRLREAEQKEQKDIEKWKEWRENLCSDPEAAFCGDNSYASIQNLHTWLQSRSGFITGQNVWSSSAISAAFGEPVLTAARCAFMRLWREMPPELWCQRPKKDRNSIPYRWLYALTGIYAEAEIPGWSSSLSGEEAEIAAAYATVEINGFPNWLSDLADAHPHAVDCVLGGELSAQLALAGEEDHLPILQDVSGGPASVKRLFAPRILVGVQCWPSAVADDKKAGHCSYALDRALQILADVLGEEERSKVADQRCPTGQAKVTMNCPA